MTKLKTTTSNDTDPLTVKQLEDEIVRKITKAPLRMTGSFDFDVPPEELFSYVSEPAQLADWFPLIKGGAVTMEGPAQ